MAVVRVVYQGDTFVVYEADTGRGRWISATGTAFPTFTPGDGFPRPHEGALFFRHDLDAWYTWDEASRAWMLSGGGSGAHASSHQDGGGDEISVTGLSGLLADAQTPAAHVHAAADTTSGRFTQARMPDAASGFLKAAGVGVDPAYTALADADIPAAIARDAEVAAEIATHAAAADPHTGYQRESEKGAASGYASLDASTLVPVAQLPAATTTAKGAVELATDGEAAANVAVQGNDARLSDARTPLAHKASHQDAGADEISVLGLAGLLADQQTPLTHDILTKHNGFPGGTTTFLRADATFAAAGGSGADPPEGSYAPGSYTIATGKFRHAVKRQQFTTTQRLTLQGTGRLSLSN